MTSFTGTFFCRFGHDIERHRRHNAHGRQRACFHSHHGPHARKKGRRHHQISIPCLTVTGGQFPRRAGALTPPA